MDALVNAQILEQVAIVVDWIPPSVNHYKEPTTIRTSSGPMKSFKLTGEAKAFRDVVCIIARGKTIAPATQRERDQVRYALTVTIYLGKGDRLDGDNGWKCIADSLQKAGVIHSDSRVRRWLLHIEDCDRGNPRTEILAERIERRLK